MPGLLSRLLFLIGVSEYRSRPLAGERGNVKAPDQDNLQESAQGNGILNGNNVLAGNAVHA